MARPFLKWAGGKRQLVQEITDRFRSANLGTYYEPFVGGGAVFFTLADQGRIQRAVLNDWNGELVDCYRTVRDFPDDLVAQLQRLEISKEIFLQLRDVLPEELPPCRRAARTIYLNKTCFNGLFRVNKKGKFNVPWGKYKNPKTLDEPNLRACSEVLNRLAALHNVDFADVVAPAQAGDAVYFDPPYVPLNPTSNFTSYTRDGFTLHDQERLAACFRELVEKGVNVIASNSNTDVVRSLYKGYQLVEVQARRAINSKGDGRGKIAELLIVS